jgi:hypothetical protein
MDSALPALERELRRGPLRWRGFTGSLLAHAMLIAAFLLPTLSDDRADRPSPVKGAATVFTPPPSSEPPEPERDLTPSAKRLDQPRIELPDASFPETPVNLSSMQLSIADDVRDQLPDVVQAQGGMLALLDKEDLTSVSYLLQAPAWEPRETTRDISRMLRIEMSPPQRWAVFRDAAQQHGIALDHYRAFALFDIAYRSCLQNAIRRRAGGAAVSAAVLEVALSSPCGFEVREVTFATSPVHP